MKNFIITIILILGVTVSAYSQSSPPPFDDDPDQLPVDGFSYILAASGIGYGIKRLYKKNH